MLSKAAFLVGVLRADAVDVRHGSVQAVSHGVSRTSSRLAAMMEQFALLTSTGTDGVLADLKEIQTEISDIKGDINSAHNATQERLTSEYQTYATAHSGALTALDATISQQRDLIALVGVEKTHLLLNGEERTPILGTLVVEKDQRDAVAVFTSTDDPLFNETVPVKFECDASLEGSCDTDTYISGVQANEKKLESLVDAARLKYATAAERYQARSKFNSAHDSTESTKGSWSSEVCKLRDAVEVVCDNLNTYTVTKNAADGSTNILSEQDRQREYKTATLIECLITSFEGDSSDFGTVDGLGRETNKCNHDDFEDLELKYDHEEILYDLCGVATNIYSRGAFSLAYPEYIKDGQGTDTTVALADYVQQTDLVMNLATAKFTYGGPAAFEFAC
jgi:hypothetical protein